MTGHIYPFCWAGPAQGDLGLGVGPDGLWYVLERTSMHWEMITQLSGDQQPISLDAAMGRIKELQQKQQARQQGKRQPLRPGVTLRSLHWPGLETIRPAPSESASWPHRVCAHYRLRPASSDELATINDMRRMAPSGKAGTRNTHGTLSELLSGLMKKDSGNYLFIGINRIAIHVRDEWHMLGWSDEQGSEIHQLPRAPRRKRGARTQPPEVPENQETPNQT